MSSEADPARALRCDRADPSTLQVIGRFFLRDFPAEQMAGVEFGCRAYIEHHAFAAIDHLRHLQRRGTLAARRQHRPEQGAAGQYDDAEHKNVVNNEFHKDPMV